MVYLANLLGTSKKGGRMETWKLEATSVEPYYPSYLGNGYLGVQTSPKGTGGRSFIAGVYGGEEEELVEVPRWSGVDFWDGGGWLRLDDGVRGYRQVLDVRRAVLLTGYSWTHGGRRTDFDMAFFVSRSDPHLAVLKFSFVPGYDGEVAVENSLDFGPSDALLPREGGGGAYHIWAEVEARSSGTRIAQAVYISPPEGVVLRQEARFPGSGRVVHRTRLHVERGRRYTFHKYVSFFTSYDSSIPSKDAEDKVAEAKDKGYERLLKEHSEAWARLWEGDILVEDPKLQRRIHACLYHLLSSVREGQDHSIPPMGLSNDGWGGRIFWDAEFFMLPALLPLYPELAESIVRYRFRTFEAARENATRQGYEGAAYPWKSARTGREVSRGGYSREIHVTGDVAWGQWQYWLATGDRDYLRRCAGPIIVETAKFWASRAVYNSEADRYEILGVVPPDESTCETWGLPTVDNSAFTNAIAAWNLRTAARVCRVLGRKPPPEWEEIADKMYLPFDRKLGVYMEYDGYGGHPIKQPDVCQMMFPLEHPMEGKLMARNFDYYLGKADRELGHSFFPSVHPIVACMLGRTEQAYELFGEWEDFFLPPFEVMREVLANDEGIVFLTAIGGFLQNFLYGFAGIRLREDGIEVNPVLPEEISRIIFPRIWFKGRAYSLVVEKRKGRDIYRMEPEAD